VGGWQHHQVCHTFAMVMVLNENRTPVSGSESEEGKPAVTLAEIRRRKQQKARQAVRVEDISELFLGWGQGT